MSLTGVIASFATGTYTVTRRDASTYVNGRSTSDSTPTTFDIVAGVRPATGRQLQQIVGLQHGTEVRAVYTTTELRTRTPDNEPDTVSIEGEDWEVVDLDHFPSFGGGHYRAMVARRVVTA